MIFQKVTLEQIEQFKVAYGFSRWIPTKDKKSAEALKNHLCTKAKECEVWVCTEELEIIGFLICTKWNVLPGAKVIDAIEIAKQYRKRGIGSTLMQSFLSNEENQNTILGLLLYPEIGYERKLKDLYKKLGFEELAQNIMIRFPTKSQMMEVWEKYIRELRDLYENMWKVVIDMRRKSK